MMSHERADSIGRPVRARYPGIVGVVISWTAWAVGVPEFGAAAVWQS